MIRLEARVLHKNMQWCHTYKCRNADLNPSRSFASLVAFNSTTFRCEGQLLQMLCECVMGHCVNKEHGLCHFQTCMYLRFAEMLTANNVSLRLGG